MSEDTKFIDPIHEQIEQKALLAQKREEIQNKELIVREHRANNAVDRIEENNKNEKIAKNTNYGVLSEEEITSKQKENTLYMRAAKQKMRFINKCFDNVVDRKSTRL